MLLDRKLPVLLDREAPAAAPVDPELLHACVLHACEVVPLHVAPDPDGAGLVQVRV